MLHTANAMAHPDTNRSGLVLLHKFFEEWWKTGVKHHGMASFYSLINKLFGTRRHTPRLCLKFSLNVVEDRREASWDGQLLQPGQQTVRDSKAYPTSVFEVLLECAPFQKLQRNPKPHRHPLVVGSGEVQEVSHLLAKVVCEFHSR